MHTRPGGVAGLAIRTMPRAPAHLFFCKHIRLIKLHTCTRSGAGSPQSSPATHSCSRRWSLDPGSPGACSSWHCESLLPRSLQLGSVPASTSVVTLCMSESPTVFLVNGRRRRPSRRRLLGSTRNGCHNYSEGSAARPRGWLQALTNSQVLVNIAGFQVQELPARSEQELAASAGGTMRRR
jgi:hypothetical protein